jgi:transposase
MAGRHTKLTKELIQKFEALLGSGNYQVTTCNALGVSISAFHQWMKKGEEAEDGLYLEFQQAVKKAEHLAEAKWLRDISQNEAWQSKAWLMERRFPERWSRKDNLALNHSGNVEVTFVPVDTLSAEEWEKRESE